LSADFLMQMA